MFHSRLSHSCGWNSFGFTHCDQLSSAFQFDGGKVICQKFGEGVENSTGIRNPSALSRGARVTRQPIFSSVRPLMTSSFVFSSSARGHMIIAPWMFTATVWQLILRVWSFSANKIVIGTRTITRWLRRLSSPASNAAPRLGSSFVLFTGQAPKSPSAD